MSTTPFDRKTAKPGDKLILKSCPAVPITFKGRGFDGDVIVEIQYQIGGPRDRILTPAQQARLEVEV